jgi:hypothetical protein
VVDPPWPGVENEESTTRSKGKRVVRGRDWSVKGRQVGDPDTLNHV